MCTLWQLSYLLGQNLIQNSLNQTACPKFTTSNLKLMCPCVCVYENLCIKKIAVIFISIHRIVSKIFDFVSKTLEKKQATIFHLRFVFHHFEASCSTRWWTFKSSAGFAWTLTLLSKIGRTDTIDKFNSCWMTLFTIWEHQIVSTFQRLSRLFRLIYSKGRFT